MTAIVVAAMTYLISYGMLDNPSNGGLNGVNGFVAAFFAVIAFGGTLLVAHAMDGQSR